MWTALSLPKDNGNIACLLRLCKAPQISLQEHSLWAAMANVIKCLANTPAPTYHHYLFGDTLILAHKQTYPPLPSPAFSSWLSLSGSGRGKGSALICQSEQPFHMASLCSSPVPERELLISPGCLASIADGWEAMLERGRGWGSRRRNWSPGQSLAGGR